MERFIKVPRILLILFFITIMQVVSYGQTANLRLEVTQQYVGNFYIGDVDFLQQNSGREIFKLEVITFPSTGQGRFDFRIDFISTEGIEKNLVNFYTNRFTIQPVTGDYDVISNSDMSSAVEVNYATEPIVIEHTDLNLNNVADIENYVQRTGKLPSGKYKFQVSFSGGGQATDDFMIVYNPTIIQLSAPGTRVTGSELLGTSPVSNTPLFQWHSDAKLFSMYVYEKLPSDKTVNDVFGHEPFAEINNITNQYFQYPLEPGVINEPVNAEGVDNHLETTSNGAVRPLQDGKVYFWYVEAKIPTVTQGVYEKLKSEVFQFKVAAVGGIQNDNIRIIEALKTMLIPDYKGQFEEFRGFTPTGEIYINGSKVTVEDLESISFDVLKRNYKIKKVIVD